MSRTYDALKRAETERQGTDKATASAPFAARATPAELEYERIHVWLRNPAAPGRKLRSVMVVACHSGSGSTTTAALLARTLAQSRHARVLLIDGNFRTPGLNLVFRIANDAGLAEIIDEGMPFEAQVRKTDQPNLFVLTSGTVASTPLDAFEEHALEELLEELKRRFDFVIFDAAPVLDFPDAFALGPKVDGVILVTEAEQTRIEDAQRARSDLERAGARILGVVLNKHVDYLPRFLRRMMGTV